MQYAFRIPFTRRHMKFTEEVREALDAEHIEYEVEVVVHYDAQESNLEFSVPAVNVDRARALVGEVARYEWRKPSV